MEAGGRREKLKKPQASERHLQVVFLSRLVVAGMDLEAHELVTTIVHYGFYERGEMEGLEAACGASRRMIAIRLSEYNLRGPALWLSVCRLLYVIWIHFRMRGSFADDIRHLGCGNENELSKLCMRIAGVRPNEARSECLEVNSILPFMDRCIPYLMKGKT